MTSRANRHFWPLLLLLSACSSASSPLTSVLVDARFRVAEHMRASREMQLSGEPFAEILNYNLAGFARSNAVTDQYDPCQAAGTGSCPHTDPLGYVLAVESYEYSKQPMNNVSFESGAGLSLMYGPVLNPAQQVGQAAYSALVTRFQQFGNESYAENDAGNSLIVPANTTSGLNWFGFPGLWPAMVPFTDFDPRIDPQPTNAFDVNTCTPGGTPGSLGYGGAPNGIANYECDYNSLNLPNRAAQVTMAISPDAMGYTVWKQGLWAINYWGTLQDTAGNGITSVAAVDLPNVGQPNNTVVGQYPDPTDPTGETLIDGAPGTYLGDIPMEGWQGMTMVEEIDNQAALLLTSLLTSDGVSLTGMSSMSAAMDYSYDSPLLFFPGVIGVTETDQTPYAIDQNELFPQPTAFAITDGSSHLAGLSGLLGGYGEAFAFTDVNNAQVGGSVPWRATFDGDPFPGEDLTRPYGQNTLHDRALSILKIAMVDLDRLHFNAQYSVLTDTATVVNGQATPGSTVTTLELNEAILAMRNAYRALNGSLQLYSNDTPDTAGAPTPFDTVNLSGATYAGGLPAHLRDLIQDEANFLSVMLVDSNGAVANGFNVSTGTVDPSPTTLESEAAGVRALLEAYLVTGNEAYRERAMQVYQDLSNRFWMSDIRLFRTTAGVDSPMQYTPIRIGTLSGALRQYYKLVANSPAQASAGQELLSRLVRTYKLVLNGWDDVNQDNKVQYPQECLPARLEMAERVLTGELGHPGDLGDRDSDCIRELSTPKNAGVSSIVFSDGGGDGFGLPAALGSELDVSRQ